MKNKKTNFSICVWLGIIAFLLLCGVILFAAYLYKFNPLSMFEEIFYLDKAVGWTALNAIGTIIIGVVTIIISSKVAKMQIEQSEIQELQSKLYTEPHILIDSITLESAECDIDNSGKIIKSIKNIDYPFFTDRIDKLELSEISLISITFINTSEAFARLRFNEATITQDEKTIAKFDLSTFGIHKQHLMLQKNNIGKIGFVINDKKIDKLNHVQLTVSCFLDNNYNRTYKDKQSYILFNQVDGLFSFMPTNLKEKTYIKL